MRATVFALAIVLAAPAAAQTAVQQVQDMVMAQNVEAGFAPATAEALATCITGVMSEDEAQVILASAPGTAQQVAVRMMQHYDDAIACTASVVQ